MDCIDAQGDLDAVRWASLLQQAPTDHRAVIVAKV